MMQHFHIFDTPANQAFIKNTIDWRKKKNLYNKQKYFYEADLCTSQEKTVILVAV